MNQKLFYVAITAIIAKDGKYLITKRSEKEKFLPGVWLVPGGKITTDDFLSRPSDTATKHQWYNIIEDVLRREVKEEVDLEITNIRYITSIAAMRPDGYPVIVVSMLADWASGEVKLNPEHTDYTWVSLEEAKNYQLLEGVYEELEMADKIIRGEKVEQWRSEKK